MPVSPLVSVVMPVYNRAGQLAEAAASILQGTLQDLELIVVDDGSTDDSATAIAAIAKSEPRLRVLSQPNAGAYLARNAGVALARGELLAMIDADDVSLPHRLERQVEFLNAHPDVLLVGGGMVMTDADGKAIRTVAVPEEHAAILKALQSHNPIHTTTVMMRMGAFRAAGGFRRAFRVAGDYDLWLRLSETGQVANIGEPLARYRVHGNQISTRRLGEQVASMAACQSAARVRRETGVDPLANAVAITPELLAGMGVTPEQLRRSEINASVWWASLLCDANNATAAIELLERADELTDTATTSRATLARIHRTYARAYDLQHRTLLQMTAAARARYHEMGLSPRNIARRFTRKLSGVSARRRKKAEGEPSTD